MARYGSGYNVAENPTMSVVRADGTKFENFLEIENALGTVHALV